MCSTHNKSHCPFYPLPSNKSKRYTTLVFFNLVTPSRITTSRIPKSPEVRFRIVWSNRNKLLVHQPAATNSMHLQPTQTPIYSTSSRMRIWNPVGSLWWHFSDRFQIVGCFLRGAPSLMFDRILNATLSQEKVSTTWVTQGNLELSLPPNSLDSHETQNNKIIFRTDPTSSFPWRTTHPLGR